MKKENLWCWLSSLRQYPSAEKIKAHEKNYLPAYVYPCMINGLPYIIYPKGLAQNSPALFEKLRHYYKHQGYALKENQRAEKCTHKYKNERKRWAPVLLFTASLLFESTANADVELDVKEYIHHKTQQIELQLISNKLIRHEVLKKLKGYDERPLNKLPKQTKIAKEIFEILQTRYQKKNSDPNYIVADFKKIANYYSHFPETVQLLKSLKDKNWTLHYDEHNWVTTANGNMFQVEQAIIHFNTRAAAQLKLNNSCRGNPVCIASPADALLHELLHTYSMLVKHNEFISQGGMNNVLYPYKHEYSIIDKERAIYFNMSQRDKVKRPQRREHTGRIVKAHCPTCIK